MQVCFFCLCCQRSWQVHRSLLSNKTRVHFWSSRFVEQCDDKCHARARAPFVPLANSVLPFSVGWTWQRFPEAAKVVNPVAQQLLDTLASRHGVHIRFVQATLCKRDGTKKSVDCVAFLGGNGRAGGERCWLELRWTRFACGVVGVARPTAFNAS